MKTAVYDSWDPNDSRVTGVAIQTETNPNYVWRAYYEGGTPRTKLPSDIKFLGIEEAKEKYLFQKGKIEECKRD